MRPTPHFLLLRSKMDVKIRTVRAIVRNNEYPVSKFVETMYTTYLDLDMIKLRRLLRKQVT